jgi:hypothetical protein
MVSGFIGIMGVVSVIHRVSGFWDLAPAGEGMHRLASLLLVRLDERDGDVHTRV